MSSIKSPKGFPDDVEGENALKVFALKLFCLKVLSKHRPQKISGTYTRHLKEKYFVEHKMTMAELRGVKIEERKPTGHNE